MSFTLRKILYLVCECLGWNWQKSVKTFGNVKSTQMTKWIFQPLSVLMVFQIIYCICSSISTSLFLFQMTVSIYLLRSLSVVIAFPASPKFRQVFYSFRKVWDYPTWLISSFVNFKLLNQLIVHWSLLI